MAVDAIDYFNLNIDTNIHQSKYLTNFKFNLKVDKKVPYIYYLVRNLSRRGWIGTRAISSAVRGCNRTAFFLSTESRILMFINYLRKRYFIECTESQVSRTS